MRCPAGTASWTGAPVTLIAASELDPLAALPSLTSLTKMSGRDGGIVRDDLVPLLSVDPILAMRALRLSHAEILGKRESPVTTASTILQRIGAGALLCMAQGSAPPLGDQRELLALWRHSIATAVAARRLAELGSFSDDVDPDVAHLCGLIHDMPLWAHLACTTVRGKRCAWGPLEWSRSWGLPPVIEAAWMATHGEIVSAGEHRDVGRVVAAAEAVATLAGFVHPGTTSNVEIELVRELSGELQGLVSLVRRELIRAVNESCLTLADIEQPATKTLPDQPRKLPPFEKGVLKMLELGDSERYRPVLTSLAAGACHYLGFDRSFYAQWIGRTQSLLIRTKYDRSAVPVGGRTVVPSPSEAALMGRVAGQGRPELLQRQENFRYNLLDHLASDGVLVVPVIGGSSTQGLLLLDRSYAATWPTLESDWTRELAFAGIGGQTLNALHLKRVGRRSQREAETDALTGLLNRRAALSHLEREIQRVRRKERPMSVLMLDLDHFKHTNDTYGHLTGDRVLAKTGQVLRQTVRATDLAARYGGEEFLVLQFDTTIEEASIVAARIFKAIQDAGEEIGVPITASIGLTDLRVDDTIESLLRRADQALYASKQQGRNRFSVDS